MFPNPSGKEFEVALYEIFIFPLYFLYVAKDKVMLFGIAFSVAGQMRRGHVG